MSIHDGHRQRFKEEFLARPDSFPDHKALELLLFYANPRGDTNPTAHALMERFDTISGVLDATPEELRKVPGVGDHAVALLKVTKELAGRYFSSRASLGEVVQSTEDAKALLEDYFVGARSERVCLLCMDGKGKSLGGGWWRPPCPSTPPGPSWPTTMFLGWPCLRRRTGTPPNS